MAQTRIYSESHLKIEYSQRASMQVHKCNTMMRQIGLGKTNMTEVTHLENIAYRIAEDFKSIYKRIE